MSTNTFHDIRELGYDVITMVKRTTIVKPL